VVCAGFAGIGCPVSCGVGMDRSRGPAGGGTRSADSSKAGANARRRQG